MKTTTHEGEMNGVMRQRKHEKIQGCRLNGRFGEPDLFCVRVYYCVKCLIHPGLRTVAGCPMYEINLLKLNQHLVDICVISCWLIMLSLVQLEITLNIWVTSQCWLTFLFTLFLSLPIFPSLSLCPACCPSADYVYFENSSSNPLLIRRIEELNKVSVCMCVCVRLRATRIRQLHVNFQTNLQTHSSSSLPQLCTETHIWLVKQSKGEILVPYNVLSLYHLFDHNCEAKDKYI